MRTSWVWAASIGLLVALTALVGACSDGDDDRSAAQDERLCSPEGLMELVPELEGADGRFAIPDPTRDLEGFLDVQHGLTNAVEITLARTNAQADAGTVADDLPETMTFGNRWRSAEIGIETDGTTVSFPDGDDLSSYGGPSFLNGVEPVEGTGGVFYAVEDDGQVPALVTAQPTTHPCVNRIELGAANTAGTWLPPSYALGRPGEETFLILDNCIDLATVRGSGDAARLGPTAELFIAIQWADIPAFAHMRTDDAGHAHRR